MSLTAVACAGPPPPPDTDAWWLDVARTDATTTPIDAHIPELQSTVRRYDVSFTLPFGAPEAVANIDVVASPGRVDMHVLIDTTASFDGEISQLQRTLTSSVIPQLRFRIESLSLGVSAFQDMPLDPFGTGSDLPFRLFAAQTSNAQFVAGAVQQLDRPLGHGGDRPESWAEALYQVATGEGLVVNGHVLAAPFRPATLPDTGTLGGVGFRERSSRVVVLITDAPTHDAVDYQPSIPNAHSLSTAVAALQALRARVVGIVSAPDARGSLEAVALATGAVAQPVAGRCPTGLSGAAHAPVAGMCPLVYDLAPDGTGLSTTLVDGLDRLLDAVAFDEVHAESDDDPREFVRAIEASRASGGDGTVPTREDLRPAGAPDGLDDTFRNVRPNVRLTFRLHMRNLMVPEQEFPQVFYLPVTVVGDGLVMRQLTVRVIVPEGPKHDD